MGESYVLISHCLQRAYHMEARAEFRDCHEQVKKINYEKCIKKKLLSSLWFWGIFIVNNAFYYIIKESTF